jgi:hypothetical protein
MGTPLTEWMGGSSRLRMIVTPKIMLWNTEYNINNNYSVISGESNR